MRLIYHIEDRGHVYIFHWFSYMIAGLRHITGCMSKFGVGGAGQFEQNTQLTESVEFKYPIKLYIPCIQKNMTSYEKETLELIKDKFEYVETIDKNDIVFNNYGENISNSKYHLLPEAYDFLRDMFLTHQNSFDLSFKNKRYYLARSKSHLLEGNVGIKRRHVLNEEEVSNDLKKYDIETIFLEDYSLIKKIQIFNEADLIISPNSGGLLFTLFSNPSTTVIEINTKNPHQISRQYMDQCNHFGIKYNKYACDNFDNLDNMVINVNNFIEFLKMQSIIS